MDWNQAIEHLIHEQIFFKTYFSCFSRPGSRTAVGFVVLFGVPLFGMMLARIVEIAYGRAKRIGLPAVVGA